MLNKTSQAIRQSNYAPGYFPGFFISALRANKQTSIRQYHQIVAQLPDVVKTETENNIRSFLKGLGSSTTKPMSVPQMDNAMPTVGSSMLAILERHKNSPATQAFLEKVAEFQKKDGLAKVLVVKGMPITQHPNNIFAHLGMLGVGHILGGKSLWKPSDKSVYSGIMKPSPVFDVISSGFEGFDDNQNSRAQIPHVDQYHDLSNIPQLGILLCISNPQKTPTYFISGRAIWDKLTSEDKAILTKDNFWLQFYGRTSEKFPIFKIDGDHANPKSVEICFDANYSDFCYDNKHKQTIQNLSKVIGELGLPYHQQHNIPANSKDTSQHISEGADAVFWHNSQGMHGRPCVYPAFGNSKPRHLVRAYFATGTAPGHTRS